MASTAIDATDSKRIRACESEIAAVYWTLSWRKRMGEEEDAEERRCGSSSRSSSSRRGPRESWRHHDGHHHFGVFVHATAGQKRTGSAYTCSDSGRVTTGPARPLLGQHQTTAPQHDDDKESPKHANIWKRNRKSFHESGQWRLPGCQVPVCRPGAASTTAGGRGQGSRNCSGRRHGGFHEGQPGGLHWLHLVMQQVRLKDGVVAPD